MKTYILYHDQCFDGFGSAYAAWQKFGDAAEYLPCAYGKPLPEVPDGADVFMIDFSSDRETILKLKERTNLVILDHHIGAQETLGGLDFAHFDMSKSGAVLAWEYFHPGTEIPPLFLYIQDRDLWKNELPNTEEVHACLASYPKTFKAWNSFQCKSWDSILLEGMTLLRYRDTLIKEICAKAEVAEMDGNNCVIVNATSHWSDVGAYLLSKYPEVTFAASYYIEGNKKKWSLRSRPDFNVCAFAKTKGGGGHAQAAGFVEIIK